jgi:hypothetical protein
MSSRPSSGAIPNVISSLAPASGVSPFAGPDGQTIDQSGRAPVLVSPFPVPARVAARAMKGTCGQNSIASYAKGVLPTFSGSKSLVEMLSAAPLRARRSIGLSLRLGERLRKNLSRYGSMEYRQTWKLRITPAGRLFWAHTASARRTSGDGCSGWRSPQNGNAEQGPKSFPFYLTCSKTGQSQITLTDQARLTGWCSPTATDPQRGVGPPRPQDTGVPLSQQVAELAGWGTPNANDWKGNATTRADEARGQLRHQIQPPGATGSPSSAETGRPAESLKLNPFFSGYLMGIPVSFLLVGIEVSNKSSKR